MVSWKETDQQLASRQFQGTREIGRPAQIRVARDMRTYNAPVPDPCPGSMAAKEQGVMRLEDQSNEQQHTTDASKGGRLCSKDGIPRTKTAAACRMGRTVEWAKAPARSLSGSQSKPGKISRKASRNERASGECTLALRRGQRRQSRDSGLTIIVLHHLVAFLFGSYRRPDLGHFGRWPFRN